MKRAALSLAVIGVVCLAANHAFAQRVVPHARAPHVTAGYGIQSAGHIATLRHYRNVGPYRRGYRGYHVYGPHGYGRAVVPRYVPRYPVAVPFHRYSRPYARPYYPSPRGFSYYGPGFSIGIGF